MKIPITDQFLLDVYQELEKIGDIGHFFLHDRRTMRDVFKGIDTPWEGRYVKDFSREQFAKLIYYLKKNNYIKVKNLESKKAVILTKKGIDKVTKAHFKTDSQERMKRKDNKWIMIIFDIPEKFKLKRELLRSILIRLGYKIFQKSVWITPYDIHEKTEKLLQFHMLDIYVKIFLVEDVS